MSVYLPSAAIGNGRLLATLGMSGEIMTAFYPRIDFSQNIHQLLPMLYIGSPGEGQLLWTYDDSFERQQRYLPDTNIVETRLHLPAPELDVILTDFVPMPDEEWPNPAIVRVIDIHNTSGQHFTGSFGHYFDLRLGEVIAKQAVRYDYGSQRFFQYFRDVAVAVGGDKPDQFRCGKAGTDDHRSARTDLTDGHLNGQAEDIGNVDFASLYSIDLAPGQSCQMTLILAFETDLHGAENMLKRLERTGAEKLQRTTEAHWRDHLKKRVPVRVHERLDEAYRRALLILAILQDGRTGSFVAAPEFDPEYRFCGGYGYCWPRDASEAADALRVAGYPEAFERLVKWYLQAQLPDGMWGQRHWAEGPLAASWSMRDSFRQLDQSAAALLSLCQWTLAEKDAVGERLEQTYPSIANAADALAELVDQHGFHRSACDLWETFEGVFAYTNAAFAVSLGAAADCAGAAGERASAAAWRSVADRAAEATLSLYDNNHFARGRYNGGGVDSTIDTATFGLLEPFTILNLSNSEHLEMAVKNLATIEQALGRDTGRGPALIRYVGDGYLGGTVGCVNTLWAAQVKLELALAMRTMDARAANSHATNAMRYVETALNHATVTGCLPELMAAEEFPYWAAPHAWASALLVKCVLLYDQWLKAAS